MALSHIFAKENILDWIDNYGMTILVAGAFAVLLSAPDRDMVSAIGGLSFMYFWVYFFHRALHFLPTEGPLRYLNTHWIFHHQPLKILDRRVELALEMINDLAMSLTVIFLQYFTGIWFVPISIVLFYAIWYTSVHIVNYSIIGSQVHKDHHKNVGTNFGPDVLDQLFGTNHEPTKEDLIPLAPNMVIAFGIVYLLKQCINWVD
jgi:sterol desaturase/sphingolipid hydroxylase (fatty acid hydroxylase superfamily)